MSDAATAEHDRTDGFVTGFASLASIRQTSAAASALRGGAHPGYSSPTHANDLLGAGAESLGSR
jgi:hypothetical protein